MRLRSSLHADLDKAQCRAKFLPLLSINKYRIKLLPEALAVAGWWRGRKRYKTPYQLSHGRSQFLDALEPLLMLGFELSAMNNSASCVVKFLHLLEQHSALLVI